MPGQALQAKRDSVAFFEMIAPFVPCDGLERIQWAYAFSKSGHSKQERDDGTRYFDHPRSVARILFELFAIWDADSVIAALLHDIVEDSFLLTERCITATFGPSVSHDVMILSKNEENKPFYYVRLARLGSWRALAVKICDRIHNLSTLDGCSREKQIKQVKETQREFPALLKLLAERIPLQFADAVPKMETMLHELCIKYQ